MSGKQIITSAVGKYVAATYQHNQQQIPGHAWVQSALGDTGTKIFSQPARQLRRWRRLPLCRVPTRTDSTRPGLGKIERETERAIDSTLRRCRGDNIVKTHTHTHTYHGIPCSPALLGLGSFPFSVACSRLHRRRLVSFSVKCLA